MRAQSNYGWLIGWYYLEKVIVRKKHNNPEYADRLNRLFMYQFCPLGGCYQHVNECMKHILNSA